MNLSVFFCIIILVWFCREKEQNDTKKLKDCLLQSQKTIASRENELCLLQKDYNALFKQQQLESDVANEKDNKWKMK